MKLLVTGASGFIGRWVVAEALRRGHEVRAMVRPASEVADLSWRGHERVELMRRDLRRRDGLADAVTGADAVVHAAAAKSGDVYTQLAGTVLATENLLDAMLDAGVNRIILISSFAVYDYLRRPAFSIVDEDTPLTADPFEREPYAQAKLIQERLAREYAERHGLRLTVLRPGAVIGPAEPWTARLGVRVSDRLWVRTGAMGRLPLSYVENCADVILTCAEKGESAGRTLNVHDDETPTLRRYCRALRSRTRPRPRVIPIPWTVMRLLGWSAAAVNRLCFGGRVRLPQILDRPNMHARCKPLRYSNRLLHEALGWEQRVGLDEALRRCFAGPVPAADTAEPADTQPSFEAKPEAAR